MEEPKSNPTGIIDRAEAVNKALEENIKKNEEILRKSEELAAKQLLAGRAEAGTTITPVKEESPQEYKRRILGR